MIAQDRSRAILAISADTGAPFGVRSWTRSHSRGHGLFASAVRRHLGGMAPKPVRGAGCRAARLEHRGSQPAGRCRKAELATSAHAEAQLGGTCRATVQPRCRLRRTFAA
ncbi:hypothetical protein GCM10023222_56040 [Saccharopolyspora cebuensis]